MRADRQIIATSHLDRHTERLTRAALESMIKQLGTYYIPVGLEHDKRFPPAGRIVGGRLVTLEDGELGVEAEIEWFDPEDSATTIRSDGRTLPPLVRHPDSIEIGYDRSLRGPAAQALVNDLGRLLGAEPHERAKKAIDPITVLEIVVGAVAYKTAGSFFDALGKDAYAAAKDRLVRFYRSRRRKGLLEVVFEALCPEGAVEVVVVVETSYPSSVEGLFDEGLPQLYARLPAMCGWLSTLRSSGGGNPHRVVLAWREDAMDVLHVLDVSGLPLVINDFPELPKVMRRAATRTRG